MKKIIIFSKYKYLYQIFNFLFTFLNKCLYLFISKLILGLSVKLDSFSIFYDFNLSKNLSVCIAIFSLNIFLLLFLI